MSRFHGWETANVTDDQGRTPRDIYDLLSNIWCEYTCAPRMRKDCSEANRTLGQCSITAFLAQYMVFPWKTGTIIVSTLSVTVFLT